MEKLILFLEILNIFGYSLIALILFIVVKWLKTNNDTLMTLAAQVKTNSDILHYLVKHNKKN